MSLPVNYSSDPHWLVSVSSNQRQVTSHISTALDFFRLRRSIQTLLSQDGCEPTGESPSSGATLSRPFEAV